MSQKQVNLFDLWVDSYIKTFFFPNTKNLNNHVIVRYLSLNV